VFDNRIKSNVIVTTKARTQDRNYQKNEEMSCQQRQSKGGSQKERSLKLAESRAVKPESKLVWIAGAGA